MKSRMSQSSSSKRTNESHGRNGRNAGRTLNTAERESTRNNPNRLRNRENLNENDDQNTGGFRSGQDFQNARFQDDQFHNESPMNSSRGDRGQPEIRRDFRATSVSGDRGRANEGYNQNSPYAAERGFSGEYSRGFGSGYGSENRDFGTGGTGFGSNDYRTPSDRMPGQARSNVWRKDRTGYGTGYGTGFNNRDYEANYGASSSWATGQHFGKGPKGYRRSDERIREEVCECLTHDPHIDASEIEVKVNNGVLTLTGTIESKHAKRHAGDIVHDISGVSDVQNQLRVESRGEMSAGYTEKVSDLTSETDASEKRSRRSAPPKSRTT